MRSLLKERRGGGGGATTGGDASIFTSSSAARHREQMAFLKYGASSKKMTASTMQKSRQHARQIAQTIGGGTTAQQLNRMAMPAPSQPASKISAFADFSSAFDGPPQQHDLFGGHDPFGDAVSDFGSETTADLFQSAAAPSAIRTNNPQKVDPFAADWPASSSQPHQHQKRSMSTLPSNSSMQSNFVQIKQQQDGSYSRSTNNNNNNNTSSSASSTGSAGAAARRRVRTQMRSNSSVNSNSSSSTTVSGSSSQQQQPSSLLANHVQNYGRQSALQRKMSMGSQSQNSGSNHSKNNHHASSGRSVGSHRSERSQRSELTTQSTATSSSAAAAPANSLFESTAGAHGGGFTFDAFGLDPLQMNAQFNQAMHDLAGSHPEMMAWAEPQQSQDDTDEQLFRQPAAAPEQGSGGFVHGFKVSAVHTTNKQSQPQRPAASQSLRMQPKPHTKGLSRFPTITTPSQLQNKRSDDNIHFVEEDSGSDTGGEPTSAAAARPQQDQDPHRFRNPQHQQQSFVPPPPSQQQQHRGPPLPQQQQPPSQQQQQHRGPPLPQQQQQQREFMDPRLAAGQQQQQHRGPPPPLQQQQQQREFMDPRLAAGQQQHQNRGPPPPQQQQQHHREFMDPRLAAGQQQQQHPPQQQHREFMDPRLAAGRPSETVGEYPKRPGSDVADFAADFDQLHQPHKQGRPVSERPQAGPNRQEGPASDFTPNFDRQPRGGRPSSEVGGFQRPQGPASDMGVASDFTPNFDPQSRGGRPGSEVGGYQRSQGPASDMGVASDFAPSDHIPLVPMDVGIRRRPAPDDDDDDSIPLQVFSSSNDKTKQVVKGSEDTATTVSTGYSSSPQHSRHIITNQNRTNEEKKDEVDRWEGGEDDPPAASPLSRENLHAFQSRYQRDDLNEQPPSRRQDAASEIAAVAKSEGGTRYPTTTSPTKWKDTQLEAAVPEFFKVQLRKTPPGSHSPPHNQFAAPQHEQRYTPPRGAQQQEPHHEQRFPQSRGPHPPQQQELPVYDQDEEEERRSRDQGMRPLPSIDTSSKTNMMFEQPPISPAMKSTGRAHTPDVEEQQDEPPLDPRAVMMKVLQRRGAPPLAGCLSISLNQQRNAESSKCKHRNGLHLYRSNHC
jgi:hypothetical protein